MYISEKDLCQKTSFKTETSQFVTKIKVFMNEVFTFLEAKAHVLRVVNQAWCAVHANSILL